jgi:endonuclease YncB( thermonuclease family)
VTVWTVPATVLRVVDGDTLMLKLDLGWHISYEARCRLIGVNAPELSTDEGAAARLWVINKLSDAGVHPLGNDYPDPVTLVSHALDKYGRPLGQVLVSTPQGETFDLGLELLESGHAVPMS